MKKIKDWFGDSIKLDKSLFFGDESELSMYLSKKSDSPGEAFELLKFICVNFEPQKSKFAETSFNELKSSCAGLRDVFSGYSNWLNANREVSSAIIEKLAESVQHFNTAWPTNYPASRLVWQPIQEQAISQGMITELLQSLREKLVKRSIGDSRGFYIVHDLLHRITEKSQISNQVSIPVLLCSEGKEEKFGRIAWLTIELIQDGGVGFAPDPTSLGMMSITFGSKDGQLLDSMDQIWQLSKVETQGFRGRWKIQGKCPIAGISAELKNNQDHEKFNVPHVLGRSMECASLVGLLAASGRIEFDECALEGTKLDSIKFFDSSMNQWKTIERYSPLELNPRFAVSCIVNDSIHGNSVLDFSLDKVGGIDAKLGKAREYKLAENVERTLIDTVLLSKNQKSEPSDKFREIEADITDATKSKNYEGLRLQYIETVRDALDWMLEINVAKKLYCEDCLEVWENDWGYAKDENGWYLRRNDKPSGEPFVDSKWSQDDEGNWIDEEGKVRVSAAEWEKDRVNTGSLDYMLNPIGGAMETEPEPDNSDAPSDDVLPDDS